MQYMNDQDTITYLGLSGCKVADGNGTMLVTGVGVNTEWGLLMASVSEDNGGETPSQVRLNGVATFIGIVGLTVAGVVLFVLVVLRYFTGHTKNAQGAKQFVGGQTKFDHVLDDLVKIITVAVTIVVVAVPEGLPLAVITMIVHTRIGSSFLPMSEDFSPAFVGLGGPGGGDAAGPFLPGGGGGGAAGPFLPGGGGGGGAGAFLAGIGGGGGGGVLVDGGGDVRDFKNWDFY